MFFIGAKKEISVEVAFSFIPVCSLPSLRKDHKYVEMKTEWIRKMLESLDFTEVTKGWRLEPYKLSRYLNARHKSACATIQVSDYGQAREEGDLRKRLNKREKC
jgi:hypothetical protein